jgi:hypothetical protein
LALTSPPTFGYDPERKSFAIGTEQVSLADFSAHHAAGHEPSDEEGAKRLIDEAYLTLSIFDTPCIMPRLTSWMKSLKTEQSQQLTDDVTDVLIDTYAEVGDAPRSKLLKGSHWGFGMSWLREAQPNLVVLGDCACLGVDLYGNMFPEHDWPDGFAELTLHNVDWPAQKTSLYAGIGSLAYFAEQAQAL